MTIRYERNGKIAVFTIENAPVNQLTPAMHQQFHDQMKAFMADQSVHVGILTGAGDRAFCGGDDIKNDWGYPSMEENLNAHFWPSDPEHPELRPGWERELKEIERFKPIIGAINGPAMGMGLIYLLCHTDIRIAVPNARLGFPEIAYGMGGAGGSTQLARHLPQAVAYWMLLTGDPLSAQDALRHDMINEIVEPENLMERAMEVAEKIAAHPPLAIRVEMEVFKRSMELPRRDAVAFTSHMYRLQRAAYLAKPGTSATPLGGKPTFE
ncbi:enoyl-CoA hydratase/isomerase family protein [Oceanibacterium hippocampi]|uniref:2,3-dehydroadipyl-CoA hydratase n=1 Tax=Oceanibacterium hippocampi TaxID=745714 RepID=A0A1Y5U331_9PROT|nr:enoyl-CoA hydratase/isomerase family protein [Oceanibacterium hippocampi]SLN75693.1 2,3-dehydroadipyl-CoA hydratase [Oceanibacterium hippocampi]